MAIPPIAWPIEGARVVLRPGNHELLVQTAWPKGPLDGLLVAVEVDGEAAGFIAIDGENRAHCAAIWLRPGARRMGYGVEAVQLLVEALRQAGQSVVTAEVPADVGLAVYFWLRLGFRPVTASPGPAGLRVVRDL